jgi:hypothetical protein
MKEARAGIVVAAALGMLAATVAAGTREGKTSPAGGSENGPRDYPVKPVPFTAVHLADAFWLPRIETNRTVSVPFAFEKCEESKRVYNFERAAAALRGEELKDKAPPGYPFDDTDVYKVIEGAAYTLSVRADPKLEAYLDGLIAKIAAAQEKDGYLYTTRTIDPQHPHPGRDGAAGSWRRSSATSSTTWATSTRPRPRTIKRRARKRCWTWPSGRPSCSIGPSGRVSSPSGPGTRSPRWDWSSSTA